MQSAGEKEQDIGRRQSCHLWAPALCQTLCWALGTHVGMKAKVKGTRTCCSWQTRSTRTLYVCKNTHSRSWRAC